MTENDIIDEEIRKVRETALLKSRERTLPTLPLKNKVLSELEWLLSLNRRELDIKKHSISPMIDKMRLEGINNERQAGYLNYLGSNCLGPTCAATAANNYGLDFVGSLLFRDNYLKYGFKKIDNSEVQPGDIVIDVVDGVGSHTMMLDNKDNGLRFNHSNGGWYAENIRKNAKYPFRGEMESYTFVGTPSDSIRWAKQYQGGGILESYANPTSAEVAVAKLALLLSDPTGVSSYPDVYYSGKELIKDPSWDNLGLFGLNVFGALPLMGKLAAPYKAAKTAKILARLGDANAIVKSADSARRVNNVIDTFPELIPGIRNMAERTLDLTSKYIVTPMFLRFSSPNKMLRVSNYRTTNGVIDWMNLSNTGSDVTLGIKEILSTNK